MVSRARLERFVDRARVNEAIERLQTITDAPFVFSVAPYFWGNVRRTAEQAFRRHRLDRTAKRNAVLLFIVPSRREFVLIGDIGAHEKLGQGVWESVVADVEAHFCKSDPTAGVIHAISEVGKRLAGFFPPVR